MQVTFARTSGTDRRLGVPLITGLQASASAQRTRSREISGIAYGAIDPSVSIRGLTHMDAVFTDHFVRALDETSVRFLVAAPVLHDAWLNRLSGFDAELGVQSETVRLRVEEGQVHEFALRLDNVPERAFPLVLGVFDADGRVVSMSELGVVTP